MIAVIGAFPTHTGDGRFLHRLPISSMMWLKRSYNIPQHDFGSDQGIFSVGEAFSTIAEAAAIFSMYRQGHPDPQDPRDQANKAIRISDHHIGVERGVFRTVRNE